MNRLPIVGVMGSGQHEHGSRAEPLGRWLATLGVNLLTGGGGGVMSAVSRAFVAVTPRLGVTIGILPSNADGSSPRAGYPNAWVEIPIRTHLPQSGERGTNPQSRNHLNILSSDVIVALPGGAGTASEMDLALRYGRPVIAFVADKSEIPGLAAEIPIGETLAKVQEFIEVNLASGLWDGTS